MRNLGKLLVGKLERIFPFCRLYKLKLQVSDLLILFINDNIFLPDLFALIKDLLLTDYSKPLGKKFALSHAVHED